MLNKIKGGANCASVVDEGPDPFSPLKIPLCPRQFNDVGTPTVQKCTGTGVACVCARAQCVIYATVMSIDCSDIEQSNSLASFSFQSHDRSHALRENAVTR